MNDQPEAPNPENEDDATYGQTSDGFEVLRGKLKSLPAGPGVYRMLNGQGDVLYVGKARNLVRRVTSYTQVNRLSMRILRMVQMTRDLEIISTHTEAEALLLEANLIKKLKPRYNIILRDDKSFPYIEVNLDHDFPMLVKHRGAREKGREYFGPFASATAVNHTLTALQKAFPLRTCSDNGCVDLELCEVFHKLTDEALRRLIVGIRIRPGAPWIKEFGVYTGNFGGYIQVEAVEVFRCGVYQRARLNGGDDGASGRDAEA